MPMCNLLVSDMPAQTAVAGKAPSLWEETSRKDFFGRLLTLHWPPAVLNNAGCNTHSSS